MAKLLLILIALSSPAWATCASAGPGIWHCPDTGNIYTNGVDLKTFLLAKPWACGDKIILYAGVEYRRPTIDLGPDWLLRHQTDCGNTNKKTEIISDKLFGIPFNQKINLVNYRALMPSLTTNASAIWQLDGYTNNYAFRGLRHASNEEAVANRSRVGNLFMGAQFEFSCSSAILATAACQSVYDNVLAGPRDIEIDRCIFEDYEEAAYGEAVGTNTDGRTYVRSVQIAIYAPFHNLYLHDSFVRLSGYTNTTSENEGHSDGFLTSAFLDMAAVTQANPAVLTGTGLLAAYGITYDAGCTTGTDNFTTINAWQTACAGHFAHVVIKGAIGNYADLNGSRYLRARADGNVDILNPNPVRAYVFGVTYYDSTSKGAFSTAGSPKASKVTLLAFYALTIAYGENYRIIDNHLEAWGMPIFVGGADGPHHDQAIIQSGSTPTSIVLDQVRDLSTGMLLTFNVAPGSGKSTYCHLNPGDGCYSTDRFRSGRVTAISGNTVTVEPWGPDGTDGTSPQVTGIAWWKNAQMSMVDLRGNNISRGYLHWNGDAGKGALEMKHCYYCLVDGNVMGGSLDANNVLRTNVGGTYFTESKSQGGSDGNVTIAFLRFSNNLASGQLGDGTTSCMYETGMVGIDQEHSILMGHHMYFSDNLHVGCKAPGGTSFPHVSVSGARDGAYIHNTYAVDMNQSPLQTRLINIKGCNYYADPFYPEYQQALRIAVKGNIMSYGVGAYLGDTSPVTVCWPDIYSSFVSNVIIDNDNATNSGALASVFPGNTYVANYTGFWSGTCAYDSWMNCTMHASNPARGTGIDGKDPGADVEQIKDRVERWSERAGLIRPNLQTVNMEPNPGAFKRGSTVTAIRFLRFESGTCTVELFTNRNRATGHADTASTSKNCSRASSINSIPGEVTFVAGAESALTASTTYFFKITEGTRVMVGEFKTRAAIGVNATLISVQLYDTVAANLRIQVSDNADMSSPTNIGLSAFASSKGTAFFSVAPGKKYYRWQTLDSGLNQLAVGPTQVMVVP